MDQERFLEACQKAAEPRTRETIGTLGEKTLHAVLKYYYAPYETDHEVKLGKYYADIVDENGITEIQTRNLGKLRDKLNCFLSVAHVTVVYPMPYEKVLIWVDPDTGKIVKRRKSPIKGAPWDCFRELYSIKDFLLNPRFSLRLLLIDIEAYQRRIRWDGTGSADATLIDRIPIALREEIVLENREDYRQLIPPGLPDRFSAQDLQEAGHISAKKAGCGIAILSNSLGLCERSGKSGKRYLYRMVPPSSGSPEPSPEPEKEPPAP